MHREMVHDRRSPDFRVRLARLRDLDRALGRVECCDIERKSAPSGARGAGPPAALQNSDPRETLVMLKRMRAVLARELDRFCGDGDDAGMDGAVVSEAGGKVAVDLMSLIVRTLEKIDLLERTIAADQAGAGAGEISGEERAALRMRVRGIVERLARERMAEMLAVDEGPALPACGGVRMTGETGGSPPGAADGRGG